jgi:hypothetical protein
LAPPASRETTAIGCSKARQQMGREQRPGLEVNGLAAEGVVERGRIVDIDRHHAVDANASSSSAT